MSISAVSSSFQGMQRGLQSLNTAAQNIASASVDGDQALVLESAVQAKQAETQFKASAAALKAENETRGTLLDVFA